MTAAISVFAERGIFGASVEEICESAGFTRGAFYSNFSDKDELVLALLRHEIDIQYSAAQVAIETMKSATESHLEAEDLVALALSAFEEAGRSGRDWILTQHELLLYAARVPKVRDSYLAFSTECLKQFSVLISDAVAYAGREFIMSFEDAIALLTAAHSHVHMDALLRGGPVDSSPMRVLVLAITRPTPDAE
ncbi:MAG: helix-turn-helix domain-containing protein [Propionibacteriaceae bacterium]